MDKEQNLSHWEKMAKNPTWNFGPTTKCKTIKRLELDCLERWITKTAHSLQRPLKILEIGCGNGINGRHILRSFPKTQYTGIDFSPSMIECAQKELPACKFLVADIRKLSELNLPNFDLIFSVRALINLSSGSEQLGVIRQCADLLNSNGRLILIEGSVQAHQELNRLRTLVGLPVRAVAEFNVFIDESQVIDPIKKSLHLEATENHTALHDFMLYIVQPLTCSGEICYDTPLMESLTDTIVRMNQAQANPNGLIGQNRAWIWNKIANS